MPKILICGNDGGAYNALAPVARMLEEIGHTIVWATEEDSKIAERVKCPTLVKDKPAAVESLLRASETKPDLVLSGVTGLKADLPLSLSQVAMGFEIPVVKVVDFWGTGQPHEQGFAPSRVCVLDEPSQRYEARMRNMPIEHVVVTGAPQFDALLDVHPIEGLRRPESPLILFVGASNEERTREIWNPVYAALASLRNEDVPAVRLGMLWHPASQPKTYAPKLMEALQGLSGVSPITDEALRKIGSMDELIATADLIVGATSTELVKACYLRRPVLSIVFPGGANERDILKPRGIERMPTSVIGATLPAGSLAPVASTIRMFLGILGDWKSMAGGMREAQAKHYQLDGKNTERVARVVTSLL